MVHRINPFYKVFSFNICELIWARLWDCRTFMKKISLILLLFCSTFMAQATQPSAVPKSLCETAMDPVAAARSYEYFLMNLISRAQHLALGFSFSPDPSEQGRMMDELRTKLKTLQGSSTSEGLATDSDHIAHDPGYLVSDFLPFDETLMQYVLRRWYQAFRALDQHTPARPTMAEQAHYALASLKDLEICIEFLRKKLEIIYAKLAIDPQENATALSTLVEIAQQSAVTGEFEQQLDAFSRLSVEGILVGLRAISDPSLRRNQLISIVTGRPLSQVTPEAQPAIPSPLVHFAPAQTPGFGAAPIVSDGGESPLILDEADRAALAELREQAAAWVQANGGSTAAGVSKEVWNKAPPTERVNLLVTAAQNNSGIRSMVSVAAKAALAARNSSNPLEAAASVVGGNVSHSLTDFLSGLASLNSNPGTSSPRPAPSMSQAATAPSPISGPLPIESVLELALTRAGLSSFQRTIALGVLRTSISLLTPENIGQFQAPLAAIVGTESAVTILNTLRTALASR